MRLRRLSALSVAALAVLVLAGCGSAAPDSSPTSTADAGGGLCAAAAPSGETAASVSVDGEFGESAVAEFSTPLEVGEAERSVLIEGDGAAIAEGDYVSYALAIFDAATGELLQEGGFGDAALPAMPIMVASGADAFFGCANEGSRLVVTTPDTGNGSQVYVIDVRGVTSADDWCAATEPGDVFPSVEFPADGIPTITIPEGDAPDGVQLEVLEEGDGAIVEPGDSVTVNYTGAKWSDGSVFDSSFERGEPATFSTTTVVPGFQRALEGQNVGSTVVVSMSPACGYGEGEINESNLTGETLVFVVEIVETAQQ